MAVSSGAFVLVSMTGIGVAADRAVPGDFLYPLDRALEALGISSDLVEERLLEAIVLIERGEMELAVATANEALAELGRSGVDATIPVLVPGTSELTADTVEEIATTTTESEAIEAATLAETVDEVAETPDVVIEAASEPVDAVHALRLATEQLLQSVRTAKSDPTTSGDVTSAAMVLAETTASASMIDVSGELTATTTDSTSTTSTSSTTSTTSTTVPQEPRPGNRGGNNSDRGTTTTTVASDPDDGSGSDDSEGDGEDDAPGPIFLPTP